MCWVEPVIFFSLVGPAPYIELLWRNQSNSSLGGTSSILKTFRVGPVKKDTLFEYDLTQYTGTESIVGVRLFIPMFERDHIDFSYSLSMNLKLPVHDSMPERVEKSLITIYICAHGQGAPRELGNEGWEDGRTRLQLWILSPQVQCLQSNAIFQCGGWIINRSSESNSFI